MIFLDIADLLHIADRTLGTYEMRDVGLLESALARPQSSPFGEDTYRTIHEKAAALVHSIARNHGLVDGNKRLALAGLFAFYGLNGRRLALTNDQAYDLIVAIASGQLDDVASIATRLEAVARPARD